MKWAFSNVGILMLGLIGILILTFLSELTVNNEQDYYSLQEATEAAAIEAVDIAYYRLTGQIKISTEKFVENFTRRFGEIRDTSAFGKGNYEIEFYEINESPPKVSVRIKDVTHEYNIYTTYDASLEKTRTDIINEISGILDVNPPE